MPLRSMEEDGPKERYTGHEKDGETGLYYAGARYLDPVVGRWMSVDPLADDVMQVDKSPYVYAWNNPTSITDPDGECPWCVGLIVGAVVEFGSQVAVNMAAGQSFGNAVSNVDYADVGIAAGVGAASGGLSTIKTLGTIAKTGIAVAGSVGEGAAKANLGSQTSDYGLTESSLGSVPLKLSREGFLPGASGWM